MAQLAQRVSSSVFSGSGRMEVRVAEAPRPGRTHRKETPRGGEGAVRAVRVVLAGAISTHCSTT